MTTTPFLLVPGPIDWALLAHQKRWLLRQAATADEAAGLLHLLDTIQDAAVDHAGVPEKFVFPTMDPGELQYGHIHRDHGQ